VFDEVIDSTGVGLCVVTGPQRGAGEGAKPDVGGGRAIGAVGRVEVTKRGQP
jgi:hypothetical protein